MSGVLCLVIVNVINYVPQKISNLSPSDVFFRAPNTPNVAPRFLGHLQENFLAMRMTPVVWVAGGSWACAPPP